MGLSGNIIKNDISDGINKGIMMLPVMQLKKLLLQ